MDDRRGGTEAVDGVLAALADPTRRQLLDLLAAQGEATATTLAARLPVSRQAVVKHLAVLDATSRWMAALASDWDRRLASIKRVAETAEREEREQQEDRTSKP